MGNFNRFPRAFSKLSSQFFCRSRFDHEMSNIAIFENPEIRDFEDISHLWDASRNFCWQQKTYGPKLYFLKL